MITLSKTLYDEAKSIGKQRHESNRKADVPMDMLADVCPYHIDAEGVAGEMAFAQHVGADESEWKKIRLVRNISAASGEDFGDCDYMGMRFDVKTTPYKAGHLLVMTTKLTGTNIDGYSLMIGEHGSYTFAGCISHGRVLQCIMNGSAAMKSRNTYWVKQSVLRPLPTKLNIEALREFNLEQIEAYKSWRGR